MDYEKGYELLKKFIEKQLMKVEKKQQAKIQQDKYLTVGISKAKLVEEYYNLLEKIER